MRKQFDHKHFFNSNFCTLLLSWRFDDDPSTHVGLLHCNSLSVMCNIVDFNPIAPNSNFCWSRKLPCWAHSVNKSGLREIQWWRSIWAIRYTCNYDRGYVVHCHSHQFRILFSVVRSTIFCVSVLLESRVLSVSAVIKNRSINCCHWTLIIYVKFYCDSESVYKTHVTHWL